TSITNDAMIRTPAARASAAFFFQAPGGATASGKSWGLDNPKNRGRINGPIPKIGSRTKPWYDKSRCNITQRALSSSLQGSNSAITAPASTHANASPTTTKPGGGVA